MTTTHRKSLVKNRQFNQQTYQQPPAQQYHMEEEGPFTHEVFTQPTPAQIQATQAQIAGQQQLLQQNNPSNQVNLIPGQQHVSGGTRILGNQRLQVAYNSQNINSKNTPHTGQTSLQQQQQQQSGGEYGQHPHLSQPSQMPGGGQPFYSGHGGNPMFGQATGTVQMETKNVTTTSITSVPLGAPLASGTSGDSDDTRATTATSGTSNSSLVPGRITDTEIRLKITGDLPLWYHQEKPKTLKYTKHMLHLFVTGVCALVGRTHIYFLKILEAVKGETPKHIKVKYSQVMFVKLEGSKKSRRKKDKESDSDPNVTYYSQNEGEAMIKTGNKGETHVLIDHFALQKKQPSSCECKDMTVPCSCLVEARRLIVDDPNAYQQFTGTTSC